MTSVQESFRFSRRTRRTAIRAYAKARTVHQLELKREVKRMSTPEVVRAIADLVRLTSGINALLFFSIAVGMVLGRCLLGSACRYERDALFLAACATIAVVVYYAGQRLGGIIDWFAEFKEGKKRFCIRDQEVC